MGSISVSAILSHKKCVSVYFNHARRIKMAVLSHRKAALRKKIATLIKQMTAEEKQRQSARVAQKLYDMPEFQRSKRVSVYLSTEDEVDTISILKKMFEEGKKCFVPTYKGNVMEMVKLESMSDYESLPKTKWNIKQPDISDNRENALDTGGVDLVITPGVAFSKSGERCGHGKGYYDTFFKKFRTLDINVPYSVGLAFKEQIVTDLPTTNLDYKLNAVLFDDSL